MSDAKEMNLNDLENVTGGAVKGVPFDQKKRDKFDEVWNKLQITADVSGTTQGVIYDMWEKHNYPLPIETFIFEALKSSRV